MPEEDKKIVRAAKRLKGLKVHFGLYFALVVVLAATNMLTTPETPWFVWPMVGWGGVLAIHTAWVMGLFDILSGDK